MSSMRKYQPIKVEIKHEKMRSRERESTKSKARILKAYLASRKEQQEEIPEELDSAMDDSWEDATLEQLDPETQWTKLEELETHLEKSGIPQDLYAEMEKELQGMPTMKDYDEATTTQIQQKMKELMKTTKAKVDKDLQKEGGKQERAEAAAKLAKLEELERAAQVAKQAAAEARRELGVSDNTAKQSKVGTKTSKAVPDEKAYEILPAEGDLEPLSLEYVMDVATRAKQTAGTALKMSNDNKAASWCAALVFLPPKWKPQWLRDAILTYDRNGWLGQSNGVMGYNETGTPIRLFLKSAEWFTHVQKQLLWCSEGKVKCILDLPGDIHQQTQQYRDVLSYFREQFSAVCEFEPEEDHFETEKPRRIPHNGNAPKNDWWSIALWLPDEPQQDKALVGIRCEYHHERQRMKYYANTKVLRFLKVTRAELIEQIEQIHTYYHWTLETTDRALDHAEHPKLTAVKEEEPPPPKSLTSDSWQEFLDNNKRTRSGAATPSSSSAPKGKGGKKGSKQSTSTQKGGYWTGYDKGYDKGKKGAKGSAKGGGKKGKKRYYDDDDY